MAFAWVCPDCGERFTDRPAAVEHEDRTQHEPSDLQRAGARGAVETATAAPGEARVLSQPDRAR